jgi:NadR type nicotinamide-nucleotide adenylyltransferase
MDKSELRALRIAILGPESSGKTTLCRFLASYFETAYANEFVRGYLRRGHVISCSEDLFTVAKRQLEVEDRRIKKANRFLFCDTELINLKVWSEQAFGGCDPRLLELVSNQRYDLYLLLKPDLPWSHDGIRQGEADRAQLFEIYRQEIERTGTPCLEVKGDKDRRHEAVMEKLREWMT